MLIKNTIALIILVSLLVGIFLGTQPDNLAAWAFVVIFVLLYSVVLTVLYEIGLLLRLGGFLEWSIERTLKVAAFSAIIPVFLLLLQSIGQLTPKDIILSLALGGLGYAYYMRISSSVTK